MISGTAGCGVRYAVRKSGSAVGWCALSVRCGTRDEAGFHSGIAHFTEHTVFKGTAHKSAAVINSYLDRLGGELNAYTTKEDITFHATVLKEDLTKAAGLLFELATCPTFPEKEIETEKGVVIDEIQSYKDSPAEDVYDRFEEALFAGHPLSRPILGTVASVKKITSDELHRFVREHFTPDRIVFTVVADFDEKRMEKAVLKLISHYFPDNHSEAGIPLENVLRTPPGGEECMEVPENHFDKTIEKRNHEVNAVLGGLAPSLYEQKERITAVLLANILGGPASNSILNRILREKNGWVYGVECGYTQYRDTGIMAISLGCDRENLDKCFREVEKAVRELQDKLLSERRLKAARKQLLGQLAIGSESGEAQCLSMSKSLMAYGRVASAEENKRWIDDISAMDIQDMAAKIFSPEKISRLIYL